MAKSFQILREKLSPEARKRAAAKTEAIIRDLPLNELRAARELTQEQLAKSLGIEQLRDIERSRRQAKRRSP